MARIMAERWAARSAGITAVRWAVPTWAECITTPTRSRASISAHITADLGTLALVKPGLVTLASGTLALATADLVTAGKLPAATAARVVLATAAIMPKGY